MLKFIDISNHQGRAGLTALLPLLSHVDAVIAKATEGSAYVDPFCDVYIQQMITSNRPWGFYHFAGAGTPVDEADFFFKNTSNYFGCGIPVLDWEGAQNVDWVNAFVRHIHAKTGIWPWIYANPWRFNQGGVEPNCMRWVASYPSVVSPSFEQAASWNAPEADGTVGAWQFCSDGVVNGVGPLDCNLFYGDEAAWLKYAGVAKSPEHTPAPEPAVDILENENYKVTIVSK